MICEKPKLVGHISDMRSILANVLETDYTNISVKAKTNEGIGELGKSQAICAHAVVLLTKQEIF